MKNTCTDETLCIEVFSKISAMVSHEIKNTLSIINENAGLLNDLAVMADQEDTGVPAEHLQRATSTIAKQVARSDRIMSNFNRFSHSGDDPISTVNLKETFELLVSLTSRQAVSNSVTVEVTCSDDLEITVALLPLEALIVIILTNSYVAAQPGAVIAVEAVQSDGDVHLSFSQCASDGTVATMYTPTAKEIILAQALSATFHHQSNTINVQLRV